MSGAIRLPHRNDFDMKSATISFGQSLIAEDLLRFEQSIYECDLLMAIGTTLTVGPINRVVPLAHSLGKPNASACEFPPALPRA